jgi:hypothetical protein
VTEGTAHEGSWNRPLPFPSLLLTCAGVWFTSGAYPKEGVLRR